MKKSIATTALGVTVAAAVVGISLWALGVADGSATSRAGELSPPAQEPVRSEKTLEVAAAATNVAKPAAAKAKDYVPATDYARPEDVPWEVFKNKKHALHLRPNRILEDGTIEYRDVPMLQMGKRTFGTMKATPTDIAPVLPEEIPADDAEARGAGSQAPVSIPTTTGNASPTPQGSATPPPGQTGGNHSPRGN